MFTIVRGSLPAWDEQERFLAFLRKDPLGHSTNDPDAHLVTEPFQDPVRQHRLGNVSIDDAFLLIGEALRDYQAFHRMDPLADPWEVFLPYARYLKKGDPIRNLTSGDVYEVREVLDKTLGRIVLKGHTAPKATDRLELDPLNEVSFSHAFPRSFAKGLKTVQAEEVADQPESGNDQITWLVQLSEPASPDRKPQRGSPGLRPRYRDTRRDPIEPDRLYEVRGFEFESVVCFDCWGRTNRRAVELLEWLEHFMFRVTWILELYGISRIHYWRRDEDEEVYRWRNDLTKRTVKYIARTERLFTLPRRALQSIEVALELSDGTEQAPVRAADTLLPPDPDLTIVSDIAEVL